MHTLVPGQWYLRYLCLNCNTTQVMFPDLSNGKSKIVATYNVNCPTCGHRGAYDAELIERYHHPPISIEVL